MKYFIIQSKGGVGKSHFTKFFILMAEMKKIMTHVIDIDNSSGSITKFFFGIQDRKSEFVKAANFKILGPDKKIDRTRFDAFLYEIAELDNVVVDFGAASSEQLIYYISEEQKNGIIETFEEMDIRLLFVMAGGGSAKECVEFFDLANKIPGIGKIATLVANEFQGGVNGNSVKEFTNAKIQIQKLHEDATSEAQKEWDKLMTDGVVYSDILNLSVIRRRRIINYLENVFNQINAAL